MGILITLLLTLTLTFGASANCDTPLLRPCPNSDLGEKSWDCPWAPIGELIVKAKTGAEIEATLKAHSPHVLDSLTQDLRQGPGLVDLWATSVNFDEIAHHTIVPPVFMQFLTESLGLKTKPAPQSHAGLQHTYGYLFSTEHTPYGFKRERWVSGVIQKGLGLTTDLGLSNEKSQSLLAQVSLLLGSFALKDDALAQEALTVLKSQAPRDLKILDPSKFPRKRIREKFRVGQNPNSREVEIRTDLIELTDLATDHPLDPGSDPVDTAAKQVLLVYSIRENGRSRLVTGFPVFESAVRDLLKPENFGDSKPIKSRYNAFIEGLSGIVMGSRTLE